MSKQTVKRYMAQLPMHGDQESIESVVLASDFEALQARHDVIAADSVRLDFMLNKWRKVVCELLPHDNFEVYVEEGFMGDKRYPGVRYSGEWEQGTPEALEIQREAIDAAITFQSNELGGDA